MIGFEFRRAEEKLGGGGRDEQWMEEKQSGQKMKYLSAVKQMPTPCLNKTLFFSAVTQYYFLKGVNCDTKYYFFNKMPWVNTCHENSRV